MLSMKQLQEKLNSSRFRQNIQLFALFLPVILFYAVFRYLPMVGTVIAFKDYKFIEGMIHSPWVGLKHFDTLFNQYQTLQIIRNSLVLGVLMIITGFPFPIMIAILMNEIRSRWYRNMIQTFIYMPYFFSWVIIGGIVLTLFSQSSGIFNHWIYQLTGDVYPFLYKPAAWIAIFLGSGIWKDSGFSAIIYLAALTTIDPSRYEAACIDGASKWRQIWHVTLPGIRSTIVLMLIITIGSVMEISFDKVYVLQNRIVSDISEVISTYVYRIGMQGGQFSLVTAMGLFESLVAFIMVLTANGIARKFGQGLW